MKIEFLPDGAEDCPLIRLFEYRSDEIEKLCQACRDLADGRIREFHLHEQPWIEPIGVCRFTWQMHFKNVGVKLPAKGVDFVLLYGDEAWREIEDKLQAFIGEFSGSYNWLTNEGDINVLISHDGNW